MKVELVFGVVLGPSYFFKAVGLSVDELGILWNWLVWISEREDQKTKGIKLCQYIALYISPNTPSLVY